MKGNKDILRRQTKRIYYAGYNTEFSGCWKMTPDGK